MPEADCTTLEWPALSRTLQARDVAIAHARAEGVSIRNQFHARVLRIDAEPIHQTARALLLSLRTNFGAVTDKIVVRGVAMHLVMDPKSWQMTHTHKHLAGRGVDQNHTVVQTSGPGDAPPPAPPHQRGDKQPRSGQAQRHRLRGQQKANNKKGWDGIPAFFCLIEIF